MPHRQLPFNKLAIELWMSDFTLQFDVDVISYPCHRLNVGVVISIK